jgi:membrane glycosyltransferase
MYAGAPMNFLMLVAGVSIILAPGAPPLATGLAFGLYAVSLGLGFAPRLLGVLDTLLRGKAASYGGVGHIVAGSILDFFFSLLIGPVMMVAQTIFIAGLGFGRRILWDAPIRAGRTIALREAIHGLWPQSLFGLVVLGLLAAFAPYAIIWACLTIIPCLLSVPFACVTASRAFSHALVRAGICAIPEEFVQIPELD